MAIEENFGFIGWNTEGTSDKIWGYFYRPTDTTVHTWYSKEYGWNCCRFWGARGKTMHFKEDVTGHELDKLKRSKLREGYKIINSDKLIEIWPNFIKEAEEKLMWDVLAGKVK